MKKYIKNYDEKTAPSILVPRLGHTKKNPITNDKVSTSMKLDITNPNTTKPARSVLARDIKELRRVYPDIPNTRLQELIQMNKQKYQEVRK